MSNTTQETLELVKAAQKNPDTDLAKSYTQSNSAVSGLTYYDLQAPAKILYPVLTPLRNEIPRVTGGAGTQANWRAITGINTGNAGAGVSEGNRGAVIAHTTADYNAAFKALGLDDNVTFEADMAAQGYDDIKARAVEGLLRGLMIAEEKIILGANSSIALGTTPTPTLTDVATGGSLNFNTAYSVICVALTHDGFLGASVAGGLPLSATRTLADGTTEAYNQGTATKSSAASVTTANDSNATHSIKASVAAVNGAIGYAWFWGASGSETLGAITTINSVLITAAATGTQTAASKFTSDVSRNSLVFDGLFSLILTPNSGAYVKTLATGIPGVGTTLTSDNAGGIVEIDTALQSFWDNYRLSPDTIWVNSQEQRNISAKILAATSSSGQRFMFNVEQGMLMGGTMVRSYTNKFSMDGAKEIAIKLHPNIPAGTILFTSKSVPYPLSNVANVLQMKLRRDYYQLQYPIRSRKYEYGVYMDGVLQCYFPPAFGIIQNIANG